MWHQRIGDAALRRDRRGGQWGRRSPGGRGSEPVDKLQGGSSMGERIVYINGRFVPESQAVISVFDRGVRWGDAVYDAARTFNHRPFKLREHIERLYRSCLHARTPLQLSRVAM